MDGLVVPVRFVPTLVPGAHLAGARVHNSTCPPVLRLHVQIFITRCQTPGIRFGLWSCHPYNTSTQAARGQTPQAAMPKPID